MDRRTLQSALVAVCGVVALGISAATLTTTVETGTGDGTGGAASGGGGMPPPPEATGPSIPLPQIPYVEELLLLAIAIAIVGTVVYLVLYWRTLIALAVGASLVLGLALVLVTFLFSAVPSTPGLLPGTGGGLVGPDSGSGGAVPSVPSLVLILLVLLATFGVVAALLGDEERETAVASDGGVEDDPEAADVGRAAGDAADRLESADAQIGNEIYRAWREMTELLEVSSPETTTPGEFESAAVESGMAPADVRELRRLFEDVRYGDREPTATDERRAVDVFRRIESTYAPEAET